MERLNPAIQSSFFRVQSGERIRTGPEEPVYVADRSSGISWKENERQEYEDSSQGNQYRRERCEGDHLGGAGNVRQDSRVDPAHAAKTARTSPTDSSEHWDE